MAEIMIDELVPDTLWLHLFGTRISWVNAGGIRTRVIEAGEGPPLLLVHGITGQAESFAKNIIPLSKHFHVRSIDLIGHGLSDKPLNVDYNIERYSKHVMDFIDAVGGGPMSLVGQSLGGWIGAWIAFKHPAYLDKLVLNTSAGLRVSISKDESAKGTRAIQAHGMRALETPTMELVRAQMMRLMHDPAKSLTDEMVAARRATFRRADTQQAMPKVLGGMETGTATTLPPDRLRQITTPTLMIWGRQNEGTTWEEAEAASKIIPHCDFHVVDDAAHWPQWEKPDEFNDVVSRWLLKK